MANTKNFYYRLEPNELFPEIVKMTIEERGEWITQVAIDLASSDEEKAETQFAKKLIAESYQFRNNRKEAGRLGGLAKSSKAKAKRSKALANSSLPLASSSSSSSNSNSKDKKHKYGEFKNVLLTDSEHQKLKDKFNGQCDELIKKLDEGIEMKGYKYKSHYLAILRVWSKSDDSAKSLIGAPFELDCEGS